MKCLRIKREGNENLAIDGVKRYISFEVFRFLVNSFPLNFCLNETIKAYRMEEKDYGSFIYSDNRDHLVFVKMLLKIDFFISLCLY